MSRARAGMATRSLLRLAGATQTPGSGNERIPMTPDAQPGCSEPWCERNREPGQGGALAHDPLHGPAPDAGSGDRPSTTEQRGNWHRHFWKCTGCDASLKDEDITLNTPQPDPGPKYADAISTTNQLQAEPKLGVTDPTLDYDRTTEAIEVLPAIADLAARLGAVEADNVDLRHEVARLRNPQGSAKAIAAQVNARAALAAPAPDGANG